MLDSQLLEIFIAAMVAGVLLFRLYMVLGRRSGQEPAPRQAEPARLSGPAADMRTDNAPAEAAPAPAGHGLLDIELADREFDRARFLQGARTAYEIILRAFAAGDRLALKPLLSEDVFNAFAGEIAARTAPPAGLADITDARIVDAHLQDADAQITVAFRARFAAADGSQHEVNDVWTFARSIGAADPNWTLIATSGELP